MGSLLLWLFAASFFEMANTGGGEADTQPQAINAACLRSSEASRGTIASASMGALYCQSCAACHGFVTGSRMGTGFFPTSYPSSPHLQVPHMSLRWYYSFGATTFT